MNYKLIKKIKDDRFDEDHIHQYDLLVNIGARDLQIAVIHDVEPRVLFMEDYVFPAASSPSEMQLLIEHLFDAHAFLTAAFWKQIRIGIKNNKFVQVPEALFIEDAMGEYLKYNAIINEDEEILSVKNTITQARTIFAFQKSLKAFFSSIYPSNEPLYIHQSATLIEGITNFAQKRKEDPLYVYIDRFKLHILSCKQGKLVYYNQFVIKQFSDYIRYIMLVMKSLHYDQQTSQVMLWGYIGKNSPHYHEFYKYINNVTFGNRPSYLKFGFMFDEQQDHHFFDLYSMYLINK